MAMTSEQECKLCRTFEFGTPSPWGGVRPDLAPPTQKNPRCALGVTLDIQYGLLLFPVPKRLHTIVCYITANHFEYFISGK